jgi:hypothetical protein
VKYREVVEIAASPPTPLFQVVDVEISVLLVWMCYNLLLSDGDVQDIGGCDIQKQEIREAVELPLTHHELYKQIGIDPPRGVLLYGPPGTGKTMLAKAVAHHTTAAFIRVVGSEFVQKYLGEVSWELLTALCMLSFCFANKIYQIDACCNFNQLIFKVFFAPSCLFMVMCRVLGSNVCFCSFENGWVETDWCF